MTAIRLLVCLFLVGIAARAAGQASPDIIPAAKMPKRLDYLGFSVARPASEQWYLRKREQTPIEAIFRRKSGAETTAPIVKVRIGKLPRAPRSAEDFGNMVRQDQIGASANRQVLSYVQNPAIINDQPAITFELEMRDVNAVIRASGYVVLHPTIPATAIAAIFRESAPSDKPDEAAAEEALVILKGVEFRSLPRHQHSELAPLFD